MSLFGYTAETFATIASIALTAMSTIVATVALIFAYRQNVGWRPVILAAGDRMSGIPGLSDHHTLYLNVEVWNRRKYPIAMRHAQAQVYGVKIRDQQPNPRSRIGHTQSNTIYRTVESTVEPGTRSLIEFEAVIDDQSFGALAPLFCSEIYFFDPHRNRLERLALDHKFFHPYLGWMNSDEERELCRRALEENPPQVPATSTAASKATD